MRVHTGSRLQARNPIRAIYGAPGVIRGRAFPMGVLCSMRKRIEAKFGVTSRISPGRSESAGAALMSLIAELKRRNVFRVGAAYAIVAWLLVEVASVVLPTLNIKR